MALRSGVGITQDLDEVKLLEKAKGKYNKMYEKATGNKRVEVEIVDETEI